jgi:hypothetical protein
MPAERKAVLLLAACQALTLSAVVLSMTLAGILGAALAPDKGLATLPIAAMVVGTAIASLPASFLMRRIGRRAGFVIGAGIGAPQRRGGGGTAVAGFLFGIGHLVTSGAGSYYRFAARGRRISANRAISWVVGGGIVCLYQPQIGSGRDWFHRMLLGSFAAPACGAGRNGAAIAVGPPPSTLDAVASPAFIAAQPALAAAILAPPSAMR